MKNYSVFEEPLILRDYLALDRTVLANERTLLSYFRLALGFVSAGVGVAGILGFLWATVLGYIFIGIGLIVLVIGIIRCRLVQKRLKDIQNITDSSLKLFE
jgi:putative membrane protein